MTTLTSTDGHEFDAYEVRPDGATASIVVIQEIFGVNSHIRSVTDRFAEAGYHAIAPAVFDRVERGVELDYDADGVAKGRDLAGALDPANTMADIAAAIAQVASTGPVGIVGYCFGGTMAWLASAQLPVAAAVGYYGGGIAGLNTLEPTVPTMLHFGELDAHIPMSDVEKIRAAHPSVPVYSYDADHGFNCDARASYDAAAAATAYERTLAFFAEHLS
ncbi:MAG: dienelactone hydrolase family protein [Acidimicrobiales bacterium]